MDEIWKAIPGFEGLYEVSNLGRVRGLDRVTQHDRNGKIYNRYIKGQILIPGIASNGYPTVNLCPGSQKDRKNHLIQHLVMLAFVGPCPEGMWCLHVKNNKTDVALINLYYGVPKSNSADAKQDNNWNRDFYVKRHWNNREAYIESRRKIRKFTPEQLKYVREQIALGRSNNGIAKEFGLDAGAVRAIKTGRTYKFE